MSIGGYFRCMGLVFCALAPGWALVRLLFLRLMRKTTDKKHELLLGAFVLYLAALLSQTLVPPQFWVGGFVDWGSLDLGLANYIPLRTILTMLREGSTPLALAINLAGNVAVFVPLGLLPPLLWPGFRPRARSAALGGLVSAGIELVQPLLGRFRDVDDLILNTLGALLGWLMFCLLYRLRPGKGTNHD